MDNIAISYDGKYLAITNNNTKIDIYDLSFNCSLQEKLNLITGVKKIKKEEENKSKNDINNLKPEWGLPMNFFSKTKLAVGLVTGLGLGSAVAMEQSQQMLSQQLSSKAACEIMNSAQTQSYIEKFSNMCRDLASRNIEVKNFYILDLNHPSMHQFVAQGIIGMVVVGGVLYFFTHNGKWFVLGPSFAQKLKGLKEHYVATSMGSVFAGGLLYYLGHEWYKKGELPLSNLLRTAKQQLEKNPRMALGLAAAGAGTVAFLKWYNYNQPKKNEQKDEEPRVEVLDENGEVNNKDEAYSPDPLAQAVANGSVEDVSRELGIYCQRHKVKDLGQSETNFKEVLMNHNNVHNLYFLCLMKSCATRSKLENQDESKVIELMKRTICLFDDEKLVSIAKEAIKSSGNDWFNVYQRICTYIYMKGNTLLEYANKLLEDARNAKNDEKITLYEEKVKQIQQLIEQEKDIQQPQEEVFEISSLFDDQEETQPAAKNETLAEKKTSGEKAEEQNTQPSVETKEETLVEQHQEEVKASQEIAEVKAEDAQPAVEKQDERRLALLKITRRPPRPGKKLSTKKGRKEWLQERKTETTGEAQKEQKESKDRIQENLQELGSTVQRLEATEYVVKTLLREAKEDTETLNRQSPTETGSLKALQADELKKEKQEEGQEQKVVATMEEKTDKLKKSGAVQIFPPLNPNQLKGSDSSKVLQSISQLAEEKQRQAKAKEQQEQQEQEQKETSKRRSVEIEKLEKKKQTNVAQKTEEKQTLVFPQLRKTVVPLPKNSENKEEKTSNPFGVQLRKTTTSSLLNK